MKKYDIITVLDLCVDFLVDLGETEPEFGQKEKIVTGYTLELGGSATIFASQTARLGLKTVGIGKVGNDIFGDFVLDKLKSIGIVLDYVQIDQSIQTGLGIALCKPHDRSILTYPGSIDAVDKEDFAESLIDQTRHIHIGSYYLTKKIQPHYAEILKKARRNGVTVSLDTNWDPTEKWESGIMDVLRYVDVIFPNENEALGITKMKTIGSAIDVLTGMVPLVVIKKGKDGSEAYSNGVKYSCESLPVIAVDTVGAGDSYDAGFIYGFLAGLDIQTCLTYGNICGGLSVTKPGGINGQPSIQCLNRNVERHQ